MLTNQEIFNKVWQHFIVEDKPYAYDPDTQLCSYLTKEGHQCAIGLFLSEKQAKDLTGMDVSDHQFGPVAIEVFGRPIHSLGNESVYNYTMNDFGRFLKRLQEAHDLSQQATSRQAQKPQFEFMLRLTATEFNLDIPSTQS